MYSKKKCIGCKRCVEACPVQALSLTSNGIHQDHSICNWCGQCVSVCPSLALEMCGTEYSVDYLMQEIEKEMLFMDHSCGGVTFCGGEPLMFPETLFDLLTRCGAIGIHRAVDTSLYAKEETVITVMNETDLFLVDLKHIDTHKHQQFCGAPNERILSNLRMIASSGKDINIRIPLIEGFNADDENITRTATFLASLPCKKKIVQLLPFHETAIGKHQKLGTIYNPNNFPFKHPSPECLQRCKAIFNQYGISANN